MKTMGFASARKENEYRIALRPEDMAKIRNVRQLYFEQGYGLRHHVPDWEYTKLGATMATREEVLSCEILCSPKAPPETEFDSFKRGQTLFGWIHAVQGRKITRALVAHQMTGIAWEDMYEVGLHLFWANNELAGEAASIHALRYFGQSPGGCQVAIIGRGNCSRGAVRILERLGCVVTVYTRATVGRLRADLPKYDIIVNAVLWDVFRTDHIITRSDLALMKPGAMIIDISCDEKMGVETSHSTTVDDPVYVVDGILHYAVDHTPALFYKTASRGISQVVSVFVDDL